MSKILLIYSYIMFICLTEAQFLKYANRFRNYSIESETNSAYLVYMKLFQDKIEHKLSVTVNITRDIHVKSILVFIYRCNYEKSDCEYFQKWTFTENLKAVVYMKNQMWSSFLDRVTPKVDIPIVKKNVYHASEMNLDTKAVVAFYPEAVNYFWKIDIAGVDNNNKKAIIIKCEYAIFAYTDRDRKRERGKQR